MQRAQQHANTTLHVYVAAYTHIYKRGAIENLEGEPPKRASDQEIIYPSGWHLRI